MIAGATAGLVVDTSLYPIDTIKSRLQSKAGLLKTGGFSNLYRGLSPVLLGSVPNGKLREREREIGDPSLDPQRNVLT